MVENGLIWNWLSHPFVLLVVGGLFTAYIIPTVTRQWQKPKQLELKTSIASQINEAVTGIIMAARFDEVTGLTDDKDFSEACIHWEKQNEVIKSLINAYFPSPRIGEEWEKFSMFVTMVYSLNLADSHMERRDWLNKLKTNFLENLTEEDIEILSRRSFQDRVSGEPTTPKFKSAWLRLADQTLSRKNSIINSIIKAKVSIS